MHLRYSSAPLVNVPRNTIPPTIDIIRAVQNEDFTFDVDSVIMEYSCWLKETTLAYDRGIRNNTEAMFSFHNE